MIIKDGIKMKKELEEILDRYEYCVHGDLMIDKILSLISLKLDKCEDEIVRYLLVDFQLEEIFKSKKITQDILNIIKNKLVLEAK